MLVYINQTELTYFITKRQDYAMGKGEGECNANGKCFIRTHFLFSYSASDVFFFFLVVSAV